MKKLTLTERMEKVEGCLMGQDDRLDKIEIQVGRNTDKLDQIQHTLDNGLGSRIADSVNTAVIREMVRVLTGAKPSTKTITLRRMAEVAIGFLVIGGIAAALFMFFMGKLTADDAAKIITAIRGGS